MIHVNDPFTRNEGSGWGTEPVSGLAYVTATTGSGSSMSVNGSRGIGVVGAAAGTASASLALSQRDVIMSATLRSSEIANGKSGAINLGRLSARQNATSGTTDRYAARLEFRLADNQLGLFISRRAANSETDVASAVVGIGQSTTNDYFVELRVEGTTSVSIEARVWRDDGSRPSTATVTYTDNSPTANLQGAGGVGWTGWVNSPHAGPYPITLQVDNFLVQDLAAPVSVILLGGL